MMKPAQDAFEEIRTADAKGRIALGARFAGRRFAIREQPDGSALLTPVIVTAESDRPLTSRRLQEAFASLEGSKDDWDGHGSLAPIPAMLDAARESLALLHSGALARGVPWTEPHVGVNERGQITLEWWVGERTLTVFIRSASQIDYLRSWGTNIETEMEDGELSRLADFAALSRWLYEDGSNDPSTSQETQTPA